jgi:excisionase family DNA binding protein
MIVKTIQITEVSIDELANIVADKLLLKIEDYLKKMSKKDNDELLSRKEVAAYLSVSYVTVGAWSKNGLINPMRMGNRVYFKKQDILDKLEKQVINKRKLG